MRHIHLYVYAICIHIYNKAVLWNICSQPSFRTSVTLSFYDLIDSSCDLISMHSECNDTSNYMALSTLFAHIQYGLIVATDCCCWCCCYLLLLLHFSLCCCAIPLAKLQFLKSIVADFYPSNGTTPFMHLSHFYRYTMNMLLLVYGTKNAHTHIITSPSIFFLYRMYTFAYWRLLITLHVEIRLIRLTHTLVLCLTIL